MGPRVSGPRLEYWGVLGPYGRCESLRGFHIMYAPFSFYFVRVGLMCSFAGDVASRGTLDAIAMIEMHGSHEPGSTILPSNAHAQRRTVDRVSEIGRSRFNRTFRNRGETRGHIKIFRSRSDVAIFVGSWDHGPR